MSDNQRPSGRNFYSRKKKFKSGRSRQTGSSQLSDMQSLFKKYDHLLEIHNHARRKLFEGHGRLDDNKVRHLKETFTKTLEDLDKFKKGLTEYQLSRFAARDLGRIDTNYSLSREIPSEGEKPVNLPPVDLHLLASQAQIKGSFADDKEESVGTFDDYLKYKGQS